MGSVHERAPMPTIEEQRALALEIAAADERFYSGLRDYWNETADAHEIMQRAVAEGLAGAANAAAQADAARERIARLEGGEA